LSTKKEKLTPSKAPPKIQKTLEIKGFSLYQPFGWVMYHHPTFDTILRNAGGYKLFRKIVV
jgi:hypothetical protein